MNSEQVPWRAHLSSTRRFVHTDQRMLRVVPGVVHVENLFHRGDEPGPAPRRDAEALDLPGLEFIRLVAK
ncbi:unnamed protein product [Gemmata massiliana]|uniref:Uncharacterized protein n=1 Tax=Gemmata massiliana TaxID=1210884 RepID=A0A6P2DAM8_9BACT|nr:hypothetical protein [Gemmata massiliana]VTR97983.1 unnamed protein product [Gemmata massiliana]